MAHSHMDQWIMSYIKCQDIGGVCYLAKLDLASAFKSVNVNTEDCHFLGSIWQDGDDKEYLVLNSIIVWIELITKII